MARPQIGQYGRIAPGIFMDHVDPPFEDDAYVRDFVPGQYGKFSFVECLEPAADALQHDLYVFGTDSGKQGEPG